LASRRKARETALKVMYLMESRGISIRDAFDEMSAVDDEIAELSDNSEIKDLKPFALGLNENQKVFVLSLIHKIDENTETLNNLIKPVLKNWDFSRISRIDRIILWIALAEMSFFLDIPTKVSINEAIELAKTFSSEKSPPFINGILDAISNNMGIKVTQ